MEEFTSDAQLTQNVLMNIFHSEYWRCCLKMWHFHEKVSKTHNYHSSANCWKMNVFSIRCIFTAHVVIFLKFIITKIVAVSECRIFNQFAYFDGNVWNVDADWYRCLFCEPNVRDIILFINAKTHLFDSQSVTLHLHSRFCK